MQGCVCRAVSLLEKTLARRGNYFEGKTPLSLLISLFFPYLSTYFFLLFTYFSSISIFFVMVFLLIYFFSLSFSLDQMLLSRPSPVCLQSSFSVFFPHFHPLPYFLASPFLLFIVSLLHSFISFPPPSLITLSPSFLPLILTPSKLLTYFLPLISNTHLRKDVVLY